MLTKIRKTLNPTNILAFMFKEERRGGVILLLAAIAALILANSSYSADYFNFIHKQLTFGSVTFDIQNWINEGLMVFFFLIVGLEVKREFIDGELRSWRMASFPIIAAVGGMLVPALIFSLFNPYVPESKGWGIPMATDIAIAVGVLGLVGNRIPKNLRIFLLSLAIIDDIGSILVIGLFYSQPTNMAALFLAVILTLVLFIVRNQNYWIVTFPIIGFLIWYCLLIAGVSGTVAGIVLAAAVPLTTRKPQSRQLQLSEIIEDMLLPVTTFIIVPLFVFANAGLEFSSFALAKSEGLTVFMGVFLGLFIGKPVGIVASAWIAVKLGLARLPSAVHWRQICGIGCLAGIGFTISIFITNLSFGTNPSLQNAAMFGIFLASILAGAIGFTVLRTNSNR